MLLPILAIAITLINVWFFTSLIKPWDYAADAAGKHFVFPDQGVSLGSFVLLLFSCSSSAPASGTKRDPKPIA